jgi:hypothetical protein
MCQLKATLNHLTELRHMDQLGVYHNNMVIPTQQNYTQAWVGGILLGGANLPWVRLG